MTTSTIRLISEFVKETRFNKTKPNTHKDFPCSSKSQTLSGYALFLYSTESNSFCNYDPRWIPQALTSVWAFEGGSQLVVQ